MQNAESAIRVWGERKDGDCTYWRHTRVEFIDETGAERIFSGYLFVCFFLKLKPKKLGGDEDDRLRIGQATGESFASL